MSKSKAAATAVTFDSERFRMLAAFDEAHQSEVLSEMARLFTDESRRWLGEAERAAARNDFVILFRVGHSLKSACDAIGAERMRLMAEQLEHAARQGLAPEASALVDDMLHECAAVLEHLRPFLQ